MNPEPLPGHEILTEPFLRQRGAVDGMLWHHHNWPVNFWKLWVEITKDKPAHVIAGLVADGYGVFSAPLGTMAMVSTPLPEVRCECGESIVWMMNAIVYEVSKITQCACDFDKWQPEKATGHSWVCPIHKRASAMYGEWLKQRPPPQQHDTLCSAHPRNRLVKVLPGWLSRLKEKPEGLMWAREGRADDWTVCSLVWSEASAILALQIVTGSYGLAYALPARVLAEIEGKNQWRDLPKHEYVKVYRPQEAKVYCTELGVQSPLSTTTSEELKDADMEIERLRIVNSALDASDAESQLRATLAETQAKLEEANKSIQNCGALLCQRADEKEALRAANAALTKERDEAQDYVNATANLLANIGDTLRSRDFTTGQLDERVIALAQKHDALARLVTAADGMKRALSELTATVKGECPSLLNEDSGGDARLDCDIEDALSAYARAKQEAGV